MRILLTGANGYIGSRLLIVLAEAGHEVIALVRSKKRLKIPSYIAMQVTPLKGDLLRPITLPEKIDAAYYLLHSMGTSSEGFSKDEALCAQNLSAALQKTSCKQIIYLSGLAPEEPLSEHMASRHHVEKILSDSNIPTTILRAGIIIGSGSASFEIIRDLVEKLPAMIAPRWVENKCQPIAIADVLFYLKEVLANPKCLDKRLEIGGPEQLTYREMLQRFAKIRGLTRVIIPVPVLTPRLSSYWLLFITSTSFPLAQALVNSLKTDAICQDNTIQTLIPHECLTYEEALKLAFEKIAQNAVVSSWKDALVMSKLGPDLSEYLSVPTHGCLSHQVALPYDDRKAAIAKLWQIGGANGWYTMNWAWSLRGFVDKLVGGVGLRRGRTHPTQLSTGDALDFWRVLVADKANGHLLLYAEMRLPGEAWLEYRIENGTVTQTATFRPKGVLGRLYWYLLVPFHHFIFRGLCQAIARGGACYD